MAFYNKQLDNYGTQKLVYQKWPESISTFVSFIFCHHDICVQGEGGPAGMY